MHPEPARYTLREGTPVWIRPIAPDDKQRLQEGLAHLSPLSRYRRFMTVPPQLSSKELKYLTEVDQVDHLAWIAVDPAQPGEPAVGVARCIRDRERPRSAEVAVTVLDAWQGRGLGTILLGVLSLAAAGQGITTFRAFVLESNAEALRLLEEVGARLGAVEGNARWFEVPVPEGLEELPDSPARRALEALARARSY